MSAQTARQFAVLSIDAELPIENRTFFTRNLDSLRQSECKNDLEAVSITNPTCTLDDFMFMNDRFASFNAVWTICSYGGNGTQVSAPQTDVQILAQVQANGSAQLRRIIDDSFREEDGGKTTIINPYYLAPEDDEEEE